MRGAREKIVIDTDPGVDDALTICAAVKAQELDVVALVVALRVQQDHAGAGRVHWVVHCVWLGPNAHMRLRISITTTSSRAPAAGVGLHARYKNTPTLATTSKNEPPTPLPSTTAA